MPALKNPRHERFAQEVAKGKSADEAYVAAGYRPARQNAHRLMTKDDVMMRVAEIQERGAVRAEITVEKVLRELAKIGFADIRKAVRWSGQAVDADGDVDETLEPQAHGGALKRSFQSAENIVQLIASDEIDEDTAAAISEVSQTAAGLKVKLYDKRAALVDIGKHLGMFKERMELTGKDGAPIEVRSLNDLSDEQLALIASGGSGGTASEA